MKKSLMVMSLLLCSVFMITGCGNNDNSGANAVTPNGSNESVVKEINKANVGDIIEFGNYEQDNNTSNGKETIEWIVLEKKDNKILVLSKHGLDAKQYNSTGANITWEQSEIRTWLNGEFTNNAFSSDEQSKLTTSTVSDKVFLLSLTEARSYSSVNGFNECKPTAYAIANGAGDTSKGYAWWWLRSTQGKEVDYLYFANEKLTEGKSIMDTESNSVRPAIWVTIG